MAINYQRMRDRSTRMIAANGTTFQAVRPGSLEVIGGVEHVHPEAPYTAIGVRTDYQPGEIDGTVIKSGDVRVVFTAEQEISIGDLVEIDGKQHRVVKPNPVKPADLVICYRAQLRA
ncbi:hypothetical protein FEM41_19935 [Jejubacter calystegiae]|uniref:Phage protein n=1 Tax=Jejubacter calystegiae TaxID=2579935 RepID=A0A4P8YLT6_9ENTR|nr:hypothetical protein [Jejubacter calystegiae]QCT21760.1 hypothetical protein FEM41_19935 [Jejubacter calystegiae]